ncbi:MAG: hypothetical protein KJI69_05435 [Patescibacteria group bacterium]|nr:hypothetical protein [Patescibacteria group bacterium]
MAKLSFERKIGGFLLIGLGIYQVILGIITILIGNTVFVGIIDIFFGAITPLLGSFAIFNILFGLLLFWAGRTIRNEPFLPKL